MSDVLVAALGNLEHALLQWAKDVRPALTDAEGDPIEYALELRRATEHHLADALSALELKVSLEYTARFRERFEGLYSLADGYKARLEQLWRREKEEAKALYEGYRQRVSPDLSALHAAVEERRKAGILALVPPGRKPTTTKEYASAIHNAFAGYRMAEKREAERLRAVAEERARHVGVVCKEVGGPDAPENGEEGAAERGDDVAAQLARLEEKTSPLDKKSGKWVRSHDAASLEGVKTGTLADYRFTGIKNEEGTLGRDTYGRVWRREGTKSSHPWYLKSTLRSQQGAAGNTP